MESPIINLTPNDIIKTDTQLLIELNRIKEWYQSDKTLLVRVEIKTKIHEIKLEQLFDIIETGRYYDWVMSMLEPKYAVKTANSSDLWVVANPDLCFEGGPKKFRNKMTHLTPKRKKRK